MVKTGLLNYRTEITGLCVGCVKTRSFWAPNCPC